MRNVSRISFRKMPETSGWFAVCAILVLAIISSPAAQAQTFSVVHAFTGSPDGAQPQYGIVMDKQGNIYGNTWFGGCTSGCDGDGTVYKIDSAGTESVLYAFGQSATDAIHPNSQLLLDGAGNVYGATQNGGSPAAGCQGPGCGTLYRVSSAGQETILYNFPPSGLTQLPNGPVLLNGSTLYGTADGLVDNFDGAVYSFNTTSGLTILHQFTGGSDGAWPFYGLTLDSTGNLYGVTYEGGTKGEGTVFKIDLSGTKTVLHNFSGMDGAYPEGQLTIDGLGNLYGVTVDGGSSKVGVMYQLSPDGTLTVLHNFTGGSHGAYPVGALINDNVGNTYGYTSKGGGKGAGTIYRIDANGNETTLHAFTGGTDGSQPNGLVTYNGALYGTTAAGGDPTCNCGVVFKISR